MMKTNINLKTEWRRMISTMRMKTVNNSVRRTVKAHLIRGSSLKWSLTARLKTISLAAGILHKISLRIYSRLPLAVTLLRTKFKIKIFRVVLWIWKRTLWEIKICK